MDNPVKQRLVDFIKYKNLSKRHFCEAIGVSPSYVSNISQSIQPAKINRISNRFQELNVGWLLTGKGEMLNEDLEKKERKKDVPCLQCAIKDAEIARLKDKIIELQDRLLNGVECKKTANIG